ncbi:MAG: hypothetical protein OEW19_01980 [Acidobacteriota bacterium]|nr:hypothetical protein [Acidobacteriota bacterium]
MHELVVLRPNGGPAAGNKFNPFLPEQGYPLDNSDVASRFGFAYNPGGRRHRRERVPAPRGRATGPEPGARAVASTTSSSRAELEVPKTGGLTIGGVTRWMSGQPLTIHDTSTDADQNDELFDPRPAGSYSGHGPPVIRRRIASTISSRLEFQEDP